MTDIEMNEIFGVRKKKFSLISDGNLPKNISFFEILEEKTKKSGGEKLFCGIVTARTVIQDIPEYLSEIKKIADEHNAYIICLNEENITGIEHVQSAVFHAKRSWFENKPISNSFEMEVLLYAAGTRQCSQASAFGLKKGKNSLYICICTAGKGDNYEDITDKNFNFKKTVCIFKKLNDVFEFSDDECQDILKISDDEEKITRLMKIFDISEEEIESVGKDRFFELVLERVALLDVSK